MKQRLIVSLAFAAGVLVAGALACSSGDRSGAPPELSAQGPLSNIQDPLWGLQSPLTDDQQPRSIPTQPAYNSPPGVGVTGGSSSEYGQVCDNYCTQFNDESCNDDCSNVCDIFRVVPESCSRELTPFFNCFQNARIACVEGGLEGGTQCEGEIEALQRCAQDAQPPEVEQPGPPDPGRNPEPSTDPTATSGGGGSGPTPPPSTTAPNPAPSGT